MNPVRNKEIIFSGMRPSTPNTSEFKRPEDGPLWVELIERAFVKVTSDEKGRQLYGDPNKGATLEQAWRTQGLLDGKLRVCLLALGRPAVETEAIENLIRKDPRQLVILLSHIFGLSDRTAIVTMYWDGNIGHCVTLLGYDGTTSRFLYHDPWPRRSLLCKEYNAAGIDAKPIDKYWSITTAELEKVVFASFIDRYCWAELTGEKYYTTLEDFKKSNFWSYFHITETGPQLQDDKDVVLGLEPGGFQSEIDLKIRLNRKQRISGGQLNVRRNWITGPPEGINPFANDIVRSFVVTLGPPPDREKVGEFAKKLERQGLLKKMRALLENPDDAKQLIAKGLEEPAGNDPSLTYLGLVESSEQILEFSRITLTNKMLNNTEWLEITVKNDVL